MLSRSLTVTKLGISHLHLFFLPQTETFCERCETVSVFCRRAEESPFPFIRIFYCKDLKCLGWCQMLHLAFSSVIRKRTENCDVTEMTDDRFVCLFLLFVVHTIYSNVE